MITHPHREEGIVRTTRAAVVMLMVATALVVLIITIGGWSVLEGMIVVDIAFILIYAVLAFYALRWNRGVLPVAASVSVLLGIFAAVAAPAWFSREAFGYAQPALSSNMIGLLCLLLVPLQIALIVFSMRGFKQGWNVEVERPSAPAAGASPNPA